MKMRMQPSAMALAMKLSRRAQPKKSQRVPITLQRVSRKGRSAYASGPTAFPTVSRF